jgi:hypothetical protein
LKEIVYTDHLKFRIKLRHIPGFLPKEIYLEAKERYFDVQTGHMVAIKEVEFAGKLREVMVCYDEKRDKVEVITIHPLKAYQKLHRIQTGRWRKL